MAKPGGTVARGYGPRHRAVRKHWEPIVQAGHGHCHQPICLMPNRWIPPGTLWDLAHDETGTTWLGPAHIKCNRIDGAKRGYIAQQRSYAMRRAMVSRW